MKNGIIFLTTRICLLIISMVFATVFPAESHAIPDTTVQPVMAARTTDSAGDYILKPGEKIEDKIRKNLFVKAHVNKTTCFVGEPILMTFKLYSRLRSNSTVTKQPSLVGFSTFDIIEYASIAESVESVQGRPFKVHVLRKSQLIPLQSGSLEIDPMEVQNKVRFIKANISTRQGTNLDDLLDQLTAEETAPGIDKSIQIQSTPVTVLVKPIPGNTPAAFNGAVGRFSISASIAATEIRANEAAVLTVELTGTGNLPMVEAPNVQWPLNIDSFGVRSKEELETAVFPLGGKKIFEYTFMPVKEGRYNLPSVVFSYFDPDSHAFKTVQTQPHTFLVTAGNGSKAHRHSTLPDSLITRKNALPPALQVLERYKSWIAFFLALFAMIIFLWKRQQLKKKMEKTRLADMKNALVDMPGDLQDALERDTFNVARQLLEKNAFIEFYRELNNVLWDAIAQKLNLPLTALNKQTIIPQLKAREWTDEMISRLESVLTECERNVYISEYHEENELAKVLTNAEKVMADIEKL